MPKLPVVAIIGRPNVGKSTLFNRLIGRRQAIVSDVPGTTRDQVAGRVEYDGMPYLLLDTGGIGGGSSDADFEKDVHAQSLLALEHADLLLFLVHGREELTASDRVIADLLRKKPRAHAPVFLVPTQCDDAEKAEAALPQFYELGISENIFPVSAAHNLGVHALEDAVIQALRAMHFGERSPAPPEDQETPEAPRVAIVGRPNVGKSSIVNALLSDVQRQTSPRLTSPVPGTTRDSTESVVRSAGREYVFIDTAGLRKRSRIEENIEGYAMLRTLQAIEEADVTVLVLDATRAIGKQDKHIAGLAIERGTGLILLVNKVDLLASPEREAYRTRLLDSFAFCRWAPVLMTSAVTRDDLPKLFALIGVVHANRVRRVTDSAISRFFQGLALKNQSVIGKSFSVHAVTQIGVSPPTFALAIRDARTLHTTALRYLENRLREVFSFEGTPLRLVKRGRDMSCHAE